MNIKADDSDITENNLSVPTWQTDRHYVLTMEHFKIMIAQQNKE